MNIPTNTYGFYLVWNPQGRAPTKRHATRDSAVAEAERLASINPFQSFYVMSADCVSRSLNVHTIPVRYPEPEAVL